MAGLIGLLMVVGGLAASCIWSGFVLTILWRWFMATSFGLPPLSIAAGIGISLVIQMLVPTPTVKDEDYSIGSALGKAFVKPAVALLMGWIVNHWMY